MGSQQRGLSPSVNGPQIKDILTQAKDQGQAQEQIIKIARSKINRSVQRNKTIALQESEHLNLQSSATNTRGGTLQWQTSRRSIRIDDHQGNPMATPQNVHNEQQ